MNPHRQSPAHVSRRARKPGTAPGLLVALALAASLSAQHPAAIPISDVTAEPNIWEAKISPDGQWVAYSWLNTATSTTRLGLRRADGTSASTMLVHTETSSIPWPYISFTWRWDAGLMRQSLMYVDTPPPGPQPRFLLLYELVDYGPLGFGALPGLTRAFHQIQGTEEWYLQQHPCGDVLAGVAFRFSTPSNLWTMNVAGTSLATLTSHTNTSSSLQLVPLDVAPSGLHALYAQITSSTTADHYEVIVNQPTGAPQPVLVGSAFNSVRMAGYLDNHTHYGSATLASTPWALIRYDITGVTYFSNSAFLGAHRPAAEPAHLGGGTKRFVAFIGSDSVAGAPIEVRLTPPVHGGDISLFTVSGALIDAYQVSCDRSTSQVAFIAVDAGGGAQVFVVPTNRELEVTFSHPIGATSVTYAASAPCEVTEICILAVAQGLLTTPIPWGPPGQIDLDPASTVILAVGAGARVSAQFSLPVDPAFFGLPFFFQAVRDNAGALNTTRPARVKYF